ncbi:MAG TPA: glycosyltransferase N-terminal domain-containing protein [Planctomycetota bacterium]|nr:glycosyltransferase N-terminal domain-containing protein [Planctomycetota bacterium]
MLRSGLGGVTPPRARRRGRATAAHLLYDLAFVGAILLGSPYFLWKIATRRRFRAGLAQRFGRVPVRPTGRSRLWIHGVSVGEVKAALPLVRLLAQRRPEFEVALSSTTETGNALLARLFPEHPRFFYPLDLPFVPGRVLERVSPCGIVLMELEIWPNFLRAASRRAVPVALVNGRISEKSWRGYRRARRLLPELDRIEVYCVQNRRYAERFLDLGVPAARVFVTGNVKFDHAGPARDAPPDPELRALLRVGPSELVVVGGSTHGGEERSLLRAARGAAARLGAPLRLLLVPRHPDRAPSVVAELAAEGGKAVLLSELRAGVPPADGAAVVVDTIGELERIYTLAAAVFVGGSLVPHGGHNVLEPVSLGKPTLFGPHTFNFEDEVNLLLEGEGARRVADERDLEAALGVLLADPEGARAMGERGARALTSQRGASERTLAVLERSFLRPSRVASRGGAG